MEDGVKMVGGGCVVAGEGRIVEGSRLRVYVDGVTWKDVSHGDGMRVLV